MLGNRVAEALSKLGINETIVQQWLGRPCGCKERQEKLNQLEVWAGRVAKDGVSKATRVIKELIYG